MRLGLTEVKFAARQIFYFMLFIPILILPYRTFGKSFSDHRRVQLLGYEKPNGRCNLVHTINLKLKSHVKTLSELKSTLLRNTF
jgi:hypothetical protein